MRLTARQRTMPPPDAIRCSSVLPSRPTHRPSSHWYSSLLRCAPGLRAITASANISNGWRYCLQKSLAFGVIPVSRRRPNRVKIHPACLKAHRQKGESAPKVSEVRCSTCVTSVRAKPRTDWIARSAPPLLSDECVGLARVVTLIPRSCTPARRSRRKGTASRISRHRLSASQKRRWHPRNGQWQPAP